MFDLEKRDCFLRETSPEVPTLVNEAAVGVQPRKKRFTVLLAFYSLLFLLALLVGCGVDGDDSPSENKCNGDCSLCPDRSGEGLYCVGYEDQSCWYCFNGQTCDSQDEVCR